MPYDIKVTRGHELVLRAGERLQERLHRKPDEGDRKAWQLLLCVARVHSAEATLEHYLVRLEY